MSDVPSILIAAAVGIGLGAFFFFGLWWTVSRSMASPRPAVWILVSLLLRTAVVVFGFVAVSNGRWERILACALGFVAVRLFATHRVLRPTEGSHAP